MTRHIGEALGDEVHSRGSNIVALGIAPWGYVQNCDSLIGLDVSRLCFYANFFVKKTLNLFEF